MAAHQLASRSLIGIVDSAHLIDAARVMTDRSIGALGVYSPDGHDLIGVITERDVTRAVSKGLNGSATRVTELMSHPPVAAEGPVSRAEAAELMRRDHVRHLIIREGDSDRIVSIREI